MPIVVIGCALVSWSRMALGHHYLSDVVAGALLGATIAAAVAAFVL
jgi:membrane-associated phospholipid phosphatase